MLDAAELENPIPRVRAALQRTDGKSMWQIADPAARILWCSMAHVDYEVYPALHWLNLPQMVRTKLSLSMWGAITLLTRFIELAPTKE